MVSITLDNALAVHDIKVIEGPQRLFVAMPSRKEDQGGFRDIVHPINAGAREQIEEMILEEYKSAVNEQGLQEDMEYQREIPQV